MTSATEAEKKTFTLIRLHLLRSANAKTQLNPPDGLSAALVSQNASFSFINFRDRVQACAFILLPASLWCPFNNGTAMCQWTDSETPPRLHCGAEKVSTMGVALHIKQDLDAFGKKNNQGSPQFKLWPCNVIKRRFVWAEVIQGLKEEKKKKLAVLKEKVAHCLFILLHLKQVTFLMGDLNRRKGKENGWPTVGPEEGKINKIRNVTHPTPRTAISSPLSEGSAPRMGARWWENL